MSWAEFLNDGGLLLNTVLESRLKFIKLALLFVEVLYEAASTFLHLIKATLQADPVGRLVTLSMLDLIIGDWVLGVPYIVRDKFLDLIFPGPFQIIIIDILDLVH